MRDIKEILQSSGIEFDEVGVSKSPITMDKLQKFFDIIVTENNAHWSNTALEHMTQPFNEMQERFKEVFKGHKQ
jgi:arsenate reductase-like glutaredoxin family protein